MENTDLMLNWNEYRGQLAAGVKEVGQVSSDTVKGYVELSSAGQKNDVLGAKVRELIALAVAVTARCNGCIAVHSEAAIRRGASKEEIVEALGVAIAVNAGAALVYSTRVMDAVNAYSHEVSTTKPSATSSAMSNASYAPG
jgi:AhpD family alkylhydroperoxidase